MPPAYRTLFLDADGTLFDYDAAEATALERSFRAGAAFGIDPCWYNRSGADALAPDPRPTYEIRALRELLDIAG